jgi:hypothetical protein
MIEFEQLTHFFSLIKYCFMTQSTVRYLFRSAAPTLCDVQYRRTINFVLLMELLLFIMATDVPD